MKTAKFWKEAGWQKHNWIPEEQYKAKQASRSSGWTRQEDAPHRKLEESPYTGSSSSGDQQREKAVLRAAGEKLGTPPPIRIGKKKMPSRGMKG